MSYVGTRGAVSSPPRAKQSLFQFTPTVNGQTVFSGVDDKGLSLKYDAGNVLVMHNGSVLDPDDFVAITGNSITLVNAANITDTINILAFSTYGVFDSYTKTEIDSSVVKLGGDQTIAGIKTFGSSPIVPSPATGVRSGAVATMQKFADEFGASLIANGYQRLPNGLIIQWGIASGSAGGSSAITFPIAFPSFCRSVTLSAIYGSGALCVAQLDASITTTGFSLGTYLAGGRTGQGAYFIAVGY